MKTFLHRWLPLLVIACLTCVYALAGGNITSCEGGCFGGVDATSGAPR